MARNQIIYQSQALFVGPTPATGFHFSSGNSGDNLILQLHRIQSINDSLSVNRTDVNQFGNLAAIDRVIVEPPTVTADFTYLDTNALNESRMGFVVDGQVSCISGILSSAQDQKNYFVLVTPEGSDANGNVGSADNNAVLAIGNGFISNFQAEGSVGNVATCSVTIEGSNERFYLGSTGKAIPAVNPTDGSDVTGKNFSIPAAVSGVAGQASAIQPGDITILLGQAGLGFDVADAKIQSYSLSVPLARESLNQLGTKFAYYKKIQFPVTATLNIEANKGDFVTGSLSNILCNDASYDVTVQLRKPSCVAGAGTIAKRYVLKGAKLDSQNGAASIGPSNTVSLQLSAQIGGPEDLTKGLFISGILT